MTSAEARNFRVSVVLVALLVVSAVFLAWTHASLNRSDLALRLSRRSLDLQNQIELMLEKSRKAEELQKRALEKMGSHGDDSQKTEEQPLKAKTPLHIPSEVSTDGLSDPNSPTFALARELSYRYHTRYWLENRPSWPKDPLPVKEKFLSFEPWHGGFNNIRMSLEMAAALALALDRTLVLPPRYKMYLRGESSFQDYFDYEDLRRGFSVIEYAEFRKLVNLGQYDGQGDAGPSGSDMGAYFRAYQSMPGVATLGKGHPLIQDKIGSQLVLCFPSCPEDAKDKEKSWFKTVQYRLHPIDTGKHPDVFETPKIVHITPILLGHFYTMVWFRDPLIGAKVKRAVRDHIHFREELFALAERVIKDIGGDFTFNCLHVRRNEFQFKEVWTPAPDIVKNIGGLFDKRDKVYIATDELSLPKEQTVRLWNDPLAMSKTKTDHAWFTPMFEAWGGRENVKFWGDFYTKLNLDKDVQKIWVGCVESIICSRAKTFVGTQKSTFSGYIHRMRGYMNDVGQKELLEAQARYPIDYYHALVGPSWGRFPSGSFGGGHPYWGREYKEAWEGVYNPFY